MAPETEKPIEKNNVYRDREAEYVNYVVIDSFYVDEAGRTQIKVSQFTARPIAAHNSASYLSGVKGKVLLELNDVRDRILKGELIFDGRS